MRPSPAGRCFGLGVLASLAVVWPLAGQSSVRVATTLEVLQQFAGFFHGRTIALVAQPAEVDGVWRLPLAAPRTFLVVPRDGAPPTRAAELRGVFYDVSRLNGSGQLGLHSALGAIVSRLHGDLVPPRETVFALDEATWADPPEPSVPTLRTVVLDPARFAGQTVTLRGRFRGQNLFGDLPFWPRQSRWDFVLQSADASIWITGARPHGRGFDLDPTSKRSAGTWLAVTGVVRHDAGLPRLEGNDIALSETEDEPALPTVAPLPAPAPAIIFTAPADREIDVPRAVPVRIQFSRDMASESFTDRVRVSYGADTAGTIPPFTITYRPENRGLEIGFEAPLARAATVRIEFLPGVTAADGAPLEPTAISFTVER